MAKELNTSIEIDAPARIVWEALTDFSRYSEWNPFFRFVGEQSKVDSWMRTLNPLAEKE